MIFLLFHFNLIISKQFFQIIILSALPILSERENLSMSGPE